MSDATRKEVQATHKILQLLEESNASGEHTLDILPGIFLIINEKNEILRGNNSFSMISKLEYEELLGKNLASYFSREHWQLFDQKLGEIRTDDFREDSLEFELGLTINGEEKPFYWFLNRLPSHNSAEGKLTIVLGEDVSKLRASEKKLMEVFSSIPLGIFVINRSGTFEGSYSRYLEVLLNQRDLEGKSVKGIIFDPVSQNLSIDEKLGVKNLDKVLGKPALEFEKFRSTFPELLLYDQSGNVNVGKWLKFVYKPVVKNGIIDRILVIVEDKSEVIKAEKAQEKAQLLEQQSIAMYESAIRDPLTGLYSRLYMQDAVVTMINSHNRENVGNVSLIMFDIDHFKSVNDTYGHSAGDEVLAAIAAIVLHQVRKTDIPIRFGGEEFMVFVPSKMEHAIILAERIRKDVEKQRFMLEGKERQVTISGGVGVHKPNEGLDDFIERVDHFLYSAKENGRNQICCEEAKS